jgi:cytoskeleton protein RodZ
VQTPGIGEYLAQQRKLRGISVDELCEITKIPRRNLERLEAGAFDAQPDGFARGFVRTVAAALGLDPDEAVMRLMREPEVDAAPAAHGYLRIAAWATALLLASGTLVFAWRLLSGWRDPADEAQRPPLTYRQDVIGDLAREREAEPPASAAAPGPEPSEPAPAGNEPVHGTPPEPEAPAAAPAP